MCCRAPAASHIAEKKMKEKPPKLITIDLNICAYVIRWQQQMASNREATAQKLCGQLPTPGAALEPQQKHGGKWGCFSLLALMKAELVNAIKNFSVSNLFLS